MTTPNYHRCAECNELVPDDGVSWCACPDPRPLSQIAYMAAMEWMRTNKMGLTLLPVGAWEAATDAVIAAHERRSSNATVE